MKINKRQLRRIIKESVSFMRNGERYTETERRPHRRPGVNGKPMDFVIYNTLNPETGTPGGGSLAVPQGMSIEDFYAKGGTAGLSDFYGKPETGADMNRKIKAAEERGDWDNWSQNEERKIKITKNQLQRVIKEEKLRLFREVHPRAAADDALMDTIEAADELYSALSKTNIGVEALSDDTLYIMTGAAEGITVKVLRRGR